MVYHIVSIDSFSGAEQRFEVSGDEAAYQTFKDAQELSDTTFLIDAETGEILAEHHDDDDDDYEPDDSDIECGFDPYCGCYTDDC